MARIPDSVRNRKGCFIILLILVLFIALLIFIGLNAGPGNNVAEDIQTLRR
jgi:hypothetical protein